MDLIRFYLSKHAKHIQTTFKVDGNDIVLPYNNPGIAVLGQQSLGSYTVQAPSYELNMTIEVFVSKIILSLPHARYTGLKNGLCGK